MNDVEAVAVLDQTIARYTAEVATFERELKSQAELAIEDWLLVEACKDYDTIDLDPDATGKSRRKQWKALREKKRNTEKMIVALQALRDIAASPEGEKLRRRFEAEVEKYS